MAAGGGGGGFMLARAFVDFTSRGFGSLFAQVTQLRTALNGLTLPPALAGAGGFGGFNVTNNQLNQTLNLINNLNVRMGQVGNVANAMGGGFSHALRSILGVASGFSAIGMAVPGLRTAALAVNILTMNVGALGGAMTVATLGLNLLVAGVIALGAGVATVGAKSVAAASEMQMLEVQFATMLGSAEKAKTAVTALADLAAKTPLELPEVTQAAKLLIAAKVPAGELVDTVRTLGDIGLPLNVPLQEMAELVARNRQQTQMYKRDLNEFTRRGIDMVGGLAAKFKVSKDEILKMTTDGKIHFQDMMDVMKAMTSQGGMFANGMAKAEKTVSGSFSSMMDSINMLFRALGKPLMEPVQALIRGVQFIAGLFSEVAETIFGIGGTSETVFSDMIKWLDAAIAHTDMFVDAMFEVTAQILDAAGGALILADALGKAFLFGFDMELRSLAADLRAMRALRNSRDRTLPPEGGSHAGPAAAGKFAFMDLNEFTKHLQKGAEGDKVAMHTEQMARDLAIMREQGIKIRGMGSGAVGTGMGPAVGEVA